MSVRAGWLPTLRQSLVFSGRQGQIDDVERSDNSLFLQTYAELYKGVRFDLGIGANQTDGPGDFRSDGTQVNANLTLTPHRTVSLNLQYRFRQDDEEGGDLEAPRRRDTRFSQISLAYRPFPAIYLFGSYRLRQQLDLEDRNFINWAASWSPFPNGSLQISLAYNETYRSEFDSVFRIFTPRVRWNITNRWYLDLSYQEARTESDIDSRESKSLRFGTRFVF
jgi:hypothetical protein